MDEPQILNDKGEIERMKVTVCLLTRNEVECLRVMLPKIPKPGPDSGFDAVVAIDGSSQDGTVEYLQAQGIPVLKQTRRGRGDAFLQAFQNINSDAYIFFSPDGNEDPLDLKRFRPLLEQGADLVIASRMMKGAHNEEDDQWLRWRKWANNVFTLLVNLIFRKDGPYISDTINGYRAIRRSSALQLGLDSIDYTIEFQMSIRAMKAKFKIVEFPTFEGSRIAGATGAPSLPTGLLFLKKLYTEFRLG